MSYTNLDSVAMTATDASADQNNVTIATVAMDTQQVLPETTYQDTEAEFVKNNSAGEELNTVQDEQSYSEDFPSQQTSLPTSASAAIIAGR